MSARGGFEKEGRRAEVHGGICQEREAKCIETRPCNGVGIPYDLGKRFDDFAADVSDEQTCEIRCDRRDGREKIDDSVRSRRISAMSVRPRC